MTKIIRLSLLIVLLIFASAIIVKAQVDTPTISVLEAKGVVNPVLSDYIERGIEQAEENNAVALIIQLDTPGGLDTAMRDII